MKKPFALALALMLALSLAACGGGASPLREGGKKVPSAALDAKNPTRLAVGEKCHFIEEEKQSVPYRWRYYISDESLIAVYADEYEDKTAFHAPPGGDKGWRKLYFEALAPGECVITLRYEDIRNAEQYSGEYVYTVVVTGATK